MLGLMVRCCGMDFRRGLGRANERYELALPVMEHKKLLVMHAGDFASRLVIADPKSPQNGPSLASSSRIDSSMDLPETSVSRTIASRFSVAGNQCSDLGKRAQGNRDVPAGLWLRYGLSPAFPHSHSSGQLLQIQMEPR